MGVRTAAAADRLRRGAWPALQSAAAGGVAYLIAGKGLGHPQPFFAPIAAVIGLSAALGRRGGQTVQLVLGVLVGIVIGDGLLALAGDGTPVLVVGTALALLAGLVLGEAAVLRNQAAASVILVIALNGGGAAGERLSDALVGGLCALLVSQALFAARPDRLLASAEHGVVEAVAAALAGPTDDDDRQSWTLEATARIHGRLGDLADARRTAGHIARRAPTRRRFATTTRTDEALLLDAVATRVLGVLLVALRDDHDPDDLERRRSAAQRELEALTPRLAQAA